MNRGTSLRKFLLTIAVFLAVLAIALGTQLAVGLTLLGSHLRLAGVLPDLKELSPFFSIVGTIFSAFAFSGVLFTVYKQAKDSASIAATQRLQTLVTFVEVLRVRGRYFADQGMANDQQDIRAKLDRVFAEVNIEYELMFPDESATRPQRVERPTPAN